MKKNIKFLIMDVDGTLTDGKIYMGNNGELFKAFDIKDGCGIHDILVPAGIIPIIITGRKSKILEKRCIELGVKELYQGIHDKKKKLNELLSAQDNQISQTEIHTYSKCAYIGDDINDLSCMESIKSAGGLIGCPANAIKKVRELADFISEKKGGDGAVREFIEWICEEF